MDSQELFELAMKHIYGDGVPEDNDLAMQLLTQAHDMGHIEATYNLGICYHYGYGTSIDLGIHTSLDRDTDVIPDALYSCFHGTFPPLFN